MLNGSRRLHQENRVPGGLWCACRRVRRRVALGTIGLVLSLPGGAAWGHVGHRFGEIFHESSVSDACALAKRDHQLVLIFVTDPAQSSTTYLERPSWQDWQMLDVILRETVPIKLEARRDAAQLAPYHVESLPVLLLLDGEGSLLARWEGNVTVADLRERLSGVLTKMDRLNVLRNAVEQAEGNQLVLRERLADAYVRADRPANALTEYLWCLNEGVAQDAALAAARRGFVLRSLVQVSKTYAPARKALLEERQKLEGRVRAGQQAVSNARDLAELNRILEEEAHTLRLFRALPADHSARYVLSYFVFDHLVEKQRYDEISFVIDPLETFRMLAREARFARIRSRASGGTAGQGDGQSGGGGAATSPGTSAEAGPEVDPRAHAVTRGALIVEALAGSGDVGRAKQLVDEIIGFENTDETRKILRNRLERANNQEVLKYLASRAPSPGGEKKPASEQESEKP
jgi:hypothetical protein